MFFVVVINLMDSMYDKGSTYDECNKFIFVISDLLSETGAISGLSESESLLIFFSSFFYEINIRYNMSSIC